jgi:predicted N-formylglutamate amidohydrolase
VQREHFEPLRIIGADRIGLSPFLLVCDHASNALPEAYGTLGLPASEFERHIAWDPGAALLVEALAGRLNAPAVLSCFSRLLIDPNRGTDDPTLVMRLSDGTVIPGNRDVTDVEIAARIAAFHDPYHRAIDDAIERALASGIAPALLSIHTFTPVWRGEPRPWHAGILWDDLLANAEGVAQWRDRIAGVLEAAMA